MSLWQRITGRSRRPLAQSFAPADVSLILEAIDNLRTHVDATMERQDALTTRAILSVVETQKLHHERIATLEKQPSTAVVVELLKGLTERVDRVMVAAQDAWRNRAQPRAVP